MVYKKGIFCKSQSDNDKKKKKLLSETYESPGNSFFGKCD